MSVTLEWLLEKIHVTWDHLEKKRTRLRLNTKSLEEIIIQMAETASPTRATTSELYQDGVKRDENPIRTLGDYSKPSHEGYRNTIELPDGNNVVPLRSDTIRGPHDIHYCMKNPKQAFVDYASSRIDEAGGKWFTFKPEQNNLGDTYNPSWKSHPNLRWRQPQNSQNNFLNPPTRFLPSGLFPNRSFNNNPQSFNNQSNLEGLVSNFMASHVARLSKFEAGFKQQQSEMTNKINTVLKAITNRITGALPSDTVKNPKQNVDPTSPVLSAQKVRKLNSFLKSSGLVPRSSDIKFVCTKEDDGDVMFIEIINNYDDSHEEELEVEVNAMTEGLGVEEDPYRGVINFTGRIKGMHVFVGNFTYIVDFMIVEDISSIIDPGLSQVVLGKPFIEISNMTHDLSLGVVKFTDEINEIVYKMPHKIEQYGSLSDLEKEHSKSVYLRNEEDKRRGVEYVMNKILGFYKECLEPGPEYLTGVADEGGVT
ncbi:hypothetical protein Tco_0921070 [Tanacetum coccineum]